MSNLPPSTLQRYIPNLFTLFRLLATPLTYFFIIKSYYGYAFLCFAAAGLSDWIDGFLARQWNVQSKFGKIFDPIADKILMVTTFLTLGYLEKLPGWLLAIVIGRDALILIAALIVFTLKLSIKFTPILSSKINTFFQILLIGTVLISQTNFYSLLPDFCQLWLVPTLIFASALTTVWSGIRYTLYFIKQVYRLYAQEN